MTRDELIKELRLRDKQLQACQEQVNTSQKEVEALKSTIGYYITKTGQILADTDVMTDQFDALEQENTSLNQQIDIYKSMFEEIETLNKNHPFCQGKAFKEIVLETMEEAKQALEEG